jgi:hypothetical protein
LFREVRAIKPIMKGVIMKGVLDRLFECIPRISSLINPLKGEVVMLFRRHTVLLVFQGLKGFDQLGSRLLR